MFNRPVHYLPGGPLFRDRISHAARDFRRRPNPLVDPSVLDRKSLGLFPRLLTIASREIVIIIMNGWMDGSDDDAYAPARHHGNAKRLFLARWSNLVRGPREKEVTQQLIRLLR